MTLGATVLVSFGATFALSLALPLVVKPLLVRLGIMDVPNERSSHERPVLRGLGLAVLVAIVAVEGALTSVSAMLQPDGWEWRFLLVITLGSLFAGLLGLGEDLRGVSVRVRSAILVAIALSAAVSLIALARDAFGGASFGWWATGAGWQLGWIAALPLWALALLAVYGLLFISSYINVANFMDGLNGISGLHGVIAGLAFAAAGFFTMGGGWLMIAGLVLAGGFAGFLPWNLTKPGAFMGDVGSYLLGGAVAVTSFAAFVSGVPVLATIGPMVVYFGDVGFTLVKRVRAGHRWDEPHKEHVYQRLQQLGMPHLAASGINAGFTVATSALGLVSIFVNPAWWWLLLALGLALVVLYQFTPRLLHSRS